MPELPEVETVRQSLTPLIGKRIIRCKIGKLPLRQKPINQRAVRAISEGNTIRGMQRIGKYLVVDTGMREGLLVHLGMSGRFRVYDEGEATDGHCHVVLTLDNGQRLVFRDPRRFGQFEPVEMECPRSHPSLIKLGPDPLIDGIDPALLAKQLAKRSTAIKLAILDQKLIAGMGNIYASETLWRAKVHPQTPADNLSTAQVRSVAKHAEQTFQDSLANRGTSLRDFVDGDGNEGGNLEYLKAYGRDGLPCRRRSCNGVIESMTLGGRNTYFCACCQKR